MSEIMEDWPGAPSEAAEEAPAKDDALEARAKALIEELVSLGFKVLNPVPTKTEYSAPTGRERRAAIVDTETTGLTPKENHIIELAILPFTYDPTTGQVCRVEEAYWGMEDPGYPLPEEITSITGITDEDVKGKRLDDEKIAQILANVDLIIAHKADFDRPFTEERIPAFIDKHWACSIKDVPWKTEHNMGAAGLEWLLFKGHDTFYKAHRAIDDCRATLHLIASQLPGSGIVPFNQLLANARRKEVMVWAFESPFSGKDALKDNGYEWFPGTEALKKCWRKRVEESAAQEEVNWLANTVYNGSKKSENIKVSENSRKIAFSSRLGPLIPIVPEIRKTQRTLAL